MQPVQMRFRWMEVSALTRWHETDPARNTDQEAHAVHEPSVPGAAGSQQRLEHPPGLKALHILQWTKPALTLTWDFQPPEPGDNTFLLF